MADEPSFPAPGAPSPERPVTETAPKRVVVTRPEPPSFAHPAKLSNDEVRALLAVDRTNRPNSFGASWKRGRIVALPTTLISVAAHVLFGSAGLWIGAAIILAALAWIARPLLRRDDWS